MRGLAPAHRQSFPPGSERENPEKHQTKQANEDDEQEDWTQKETFFVYVCQRWNRRDKEQLEMTLVSDCVVNS